MSKLNAAVTLNAAQADLVRGILEREQDRLEIAISAAETDAPYQWVARRNLSVFRARAEQVRLALRAFPDSAGQPAIDHSSQGNCECYPQCAKAAAGY